MTDDLTLSFYGDVCLQGIAQRTFDIAPEIRERMRASTLNICNLESPVTDAREPIPYQAIHIKSAPDPEGLVRLFDVFSLANNHILDYQRAGLRDTTDFLSACGKQFFGAGTTLREAVRPLTLTAGGRRLAFLACTRWHCAGRRRAGAAPDNARRLTRQIRQLHADGHFVVVMPHWNYEYVGLPSPGNRRLAFRLIDAGADLVVGAHPHVLQPCETYQGKLICHSLGNFVFHRSLLGPPDANDRTPSYAAVLTVRIAPNGTYSHEVIPVYTDAERIRVADRAEAAEVGERLSRLADQLRDPTGYPGAFYREAAGVIRTFSSRLGQEVRRQGPMYLLTRLHRLRLEDLLIRLYPRPAGRDPDSVYPSESGGVTGGRPP